MKSHNVFLLFFLGLSFFSCSNNDAIENSMNMTLTNIRASTMSDEVVGNVESYIQSIINSHKLPTDSVILYDVGTSQIIVSLRDTVNFPRSKRFPNTFVIDFGSGTNGKIYTLKGKLIVYAKDTISSRAMSKKIIYKDFYIDGNKLIGSKLITYKGSSSKINPTNFDSIYFLISSHDTITYGNGQSVWNSYLTKQCIKLGGDTIKYTTTGYAGGANDKNQKYTSGINVANPLIRYSTYPYVVKGLLTITTNDQTYSFDYGDGIRDDKGILNYSNGLFKTLSIK